MEEQHLGSGRLTQREEYRGVQVGVYNQIQL